jgi:hypothetical protein
MPGRNNMKTFPICRSISFLVVVALSLDAVAVARGHELFVGGPRRLQKFVKSKRDVRAKHRIAAQLRRHQQNPAERGKQKGEQRKKNISRKLQNILFSRFCPPFVLA